MPVATRSNDETLARDGEIVTFTGRTIAPLNPSVDKINIVDIAHATSNLCRFTGHVREFYSVAQHCVFVSYYANREDALWGLLHDASEAYLADMARPIKLQPGFGEVYKAAEATIMRAICDKFGLPHDMPDSVRHADDVLLRTEQRDLMPNLRRHEGEDYYYHEIDGWLPADAKAAFLNRYQELTGETPKR